jgi:hypothetical protein
VGFKTVQTNFSAGEVGSLMNMRTDTGAYANGAKKLRNVALLNQGGIARRCGTTYLATLGAQTRLIPFEFAFDEQYVFAFSNTTLKIYDLTGTLLTTLTSCPWTTSMLFELTYSQIADVMIVCHPDMVTQKITRTGASSFTRTNFTFDQANNATYTYEPFYKFAANSITLSSSASAIGSTTLTTSAAYFTAAHVGIILKWYDSEILITGYTNSTTATGTIRKILEGLLDIDPIKTTDGSNRIEVTHVAHGLATGATLVFSGINGFSGITSNQLNGSRTITVIDDDTYSFTAGSNASASADGGGPHVTFSGTNIPTRNWREQSFSTLRGYPAAVTFHEGRLWFGGTNSQPDALWASKIYQFFNFDINEGLDNDSIQVTIGSNDISSVRHIVSNRNLQIFTATSEFYVPRINDTTITPSNITISRQTPYGSSKIAPTPFDGATIYVQSSLKAIREFTYNSAEEAYASPTLSILAEHLITSPQDMAVNYGTTKRGEQYLLLINSDGTIAQFTSSRAEKIAGWTLWTTEGGGSPKFESACTLGDATFVAVKRDTAYFLEKFAEDDLTTPLDCAISYTSGSAQTVWTVSSIFAGKEVDVISGNYYLGKYTVNGSNQITLNTAVTSITVGYSFTVEIQTMPVEITDRSGSYNGKPKRISRVLMDLNETLSVSIQGNRLIIRQVNDDFSEQPTPVTGKREFFLLGYSRDASVTITQSEPLPLRLNGLVMEVSV